MRIYNDIKKYVADMPPYTTLLMYYLCKDKRDKPNKNKKIKLLKKRLHRAEKKRDEIERYIETLDDPKESMILQLVYVDGLTLSQAANEMKYSESTAKRIHKSAITNLEDKAMLYDDEN